MQGGAVRKYSYVGPPEHFSRARQETAGTLIVGRRDLASWLERLGDAEAREPFTFTVGELGDLRLAPRRTEHVVCAAGAAVLAAGEVSFERGAEGEWSVVEISNQSTGYCPQPESWDAVERALGDAGIEHPGTFTHAFVFRTCAACGSINVVREGHFYCAVCDQELPESA